MAGVIQGYYGGRVGGAATITPRTSTPTPDRNPNLRPGLPFRGNLDEYFPKDADVQAEPGLTRGIWISDDEYVPLPPGHVIYETDAEGIHKMFAAKRAHTAFPLTQAPLPNSSQLPRMASTSVSAPFILEPPPLGSKLLFDEHSTSSHQRWDPRTH